MAQQVEFKINDVVQSYNPGVPDPDVRMVLDDEAIIGFKDTITRTNCVFKAITEITDDAEDTAEYDAWLACSPILLDGDVVLTDDDEILTD